jgi:hypothetical protein
MNYKHILIVPVILLPLLLAGCYTQFYRPGMEQGGNGPYGTLYNRYDSTAIDTTLTPPEPGEMQSYPPVEDYGWQYWGRPRGYTRWGFDFNNFEPDYYSSYYGYFDYYGRPWWNSYYNPGYGGWYGGNNGYGVPAEPPSKRGAGRGRDEGQPAGGGYSPPPAPPAGGGYAPAPASPTPQGGGATPAPATPDDGKRSGGRGR